MSVQRSSAHRLVLWLAVVLSPAAVAQSLQSGPMVGYSTMREVVVWVQTVAPARVRLRYWPENVETEARFSDAVDTFSASGHTARLTAALLEPGTHYRYQVEVDGQIIQPRHSQLFQSQPLWQWRGDPPAFDFALGSCAFVNETRFDRPGTPYGSNYHIFQTIAGRAPDFMLWLGDNTYLREVDWNSRAGIYARHTHTRSLPEMQALLAGSHHYAVWDDHDYGPDNADRSFWNKHIALEAFQDFWANPNYGIAGGGITGSFQWHDSQFFLLDNRWFRSNNDRVTGDRQIFGPAQVQWLIDALKYSKASFKFVVSPGGFLYDRASGESAMNIAPQERATIIELITREKIPGVLFLSGDVHHSRFMTLQRDGSYPLYEWTVSALTAGSHTPSNPRITNVVDGSVVVENNFGMVNVTGPRADRRLLLQTISHDGELKWQREIRATDLCAPAECETGH